jgi:hypothetical protein
MKARLVVQAEPPLFLWRQHRRKLCQNTDDRHNQAEENYFFHKRAST